MSPEPRWPAGLNPDEVPVYTHNELVTTVPVSSLWTVLLNAVDWPTWYSHAANVRTADGEPVLHLGSVIEWRTMGVNVTCEVVEFEPQRSLAWTARGMVSRGFHRFDFLAEPGGQTRITTEETETGLGPRLLGKRLRADLEAAHALWLEALENRAGLAGASPS